MKRPLLLGALALGFAAFACQVVAGISRVEPVDPPVEAAAPEAAPPIDANAPDLCAHVMPPPLPAVDDDPNGSIPDFYIALRSVKIVAPNGSPPLGFDLDGVCSCDKRQPTAGDGGQSCVGPTPFCDGDGGVDNEVATFANDFAALIDIDTAANINGRIQTGNQTTIVVISKYNGLANDREVGIGIFTSEGIALDNPGCPDAGSGVEHLYPGWCGADRWTVSNTSVNESGGKFTPKSVGTGYVSNYRFVVSFAGSADIPFGGYRLALGSPVSTGLLVPLDANLKALDTSAGPPPKDQIKFWRFDDGTLAGRVPITEILAAVGTVVMPGGDAAAGGTHLCGTPTFGVVKAEICKRQDINGSQKLDFTAGAACNALSTAVGITGGPVQLGAIVPAPAITNDCYPTPDGSTPVGHSNVSYRCP